MPGLFNLDRCSIRRLRRHSVKGKSQSIISMVNTHPPLQSTPYILQSPLQFSSGRLQLGQTIQCRKSQVIISSVGNGRATNKCRKVFLRKNEVLDCRSHTMNIIHLLYLHLIGTHIHRPLRLVILLVLQIHLGIRRRKGLHQETNTTLLPMSSPRTLQKRTKSNKRSHLIRLVGSHELQHRKVFGGESEGSNSLSAVDVEGPDGFAKDSGEAGEEVGEGGAGVEVADYVAALLIKKIIQILLRTLASLPLHFGHDILLAIFAMMALARMFMPMIQHIHVGGRGSRGRVAESHVPNESY
mmetsp:Transcript_17437/g.37740  ORF Transcript_17437/g.37740 Transcript_17437/m.37740 type:complete len:298 (+) Transcript_17437:2839-3732(+)